MSFRAKLLLCVLLLATIALDACSLFVMSQSTALNLKRERARALADHYQLVESASARLQTLPDASNALPLLHNYLVRNQAGALFWYVDGQPALGGAPMSIPGDLIEGDGLRRTVVSGEWLLSASSLPEPNAHISLVSATSLQPLIEMNRTLSGQMFATTLFTSALLLLLSWGLITGLLAPVARLSHAMGRAMEGILPPGCASRVRVRSRNCPGDLTAWRLLPSATWRSS